MTGTNGRTVRRAIGRIAQRVSGLALLAGIATAISSSALSAAHSARLEGMSLAVATTAGEAKELMPENAGIGMVVCVALKDAEVAALPKNWLVCDGREIS